LQIKVKLDYLRNEGKKCSNVSYIIFMPGEQYDKYPSLSGREDTYKYISPVLLSRLASTSLEN